VALRWPCDGPAVALRWPCGGPAVALRWPCDGPAVCGGSQVTLRPLTAAFAGWANPTAVMEAELRYYSSLTVGATILIDYDDKTHALEVGSVAEQAVRQRSSEEAVLLGCARS